MSFHKNRNAFTLVELLVVIAIIGVLAALLLPAVNAARGAARKTECVNNMRNVSQAMLNYESAQGQLPPYARAIGDINQGNFHIAGLIYSVLPQIEKSVLRDEIDELISAGAVNLRDPLNGIQSSTSLKIVNCPSNPSLNAEGSPIGYVANGARFQAVSAPYAGKERSNGGLSIEMSRINGPSAALTLDFISSRDGTSLTALISENVRFTSSDWRPIPVTQGGAIEGVLREQTMVWSDQFKGGWKTDRGAEYQGSADFGAFNQQLSDSSGDPARTSTPSSYHAGGFVVGFADSHVSFVPSNIDYHIYAGMLTSDGRDVVVTVGPVGNRSYQELSISADDISN